MDTEEISQVRGAKVIDLNGDKIGKVEEIYLDKDTDKPEWVLVNTGLFGSSSTFVPLQGSTRQGDDLQVSFDKDQV
nr:PRC-barrel domain-containing protein [Actinomycetota bacterium]